MFYYKVWDYFNYKPKGNVTTLLCVLRFSHVLLWLGDQIGRRGNDLNATSKKAFVEIFKEVFMS